MRESTRNTSAHRDFLVLLGNVRLPWTTAGRPPAERCPRSPKGRRASETSAPGSSDTSSVSAGRVDASKINFIHTCCVSVVLL